MNGFARRFVLTQRQKATRKLHAKSSVPSEMGNILKIKTRK